MPSPSTDSRKAATGHSGSSSSVCSDARPPAPETPSWRPQSRARAREDLDVAGFVGQLGGEELHRLAVVGVDPPDEAGRHHQRGLLVLDQVGHDLDDGRFHLVGQLRRRPVDGRSGSHWLAAAWA